MLGDSLYLENIQEYVQDEDKIVNTSSVWKSVDENYYDPLFTPTPGYI